MNKKILFLLTISILIIQSQLLSQSQFVSKEEVAEYLKGEWNMNVVQGGFAEGIYYLPTPNYYDSSYHRIVFESIEIDSTPLICKAFINDTLYQETSVSINESIEDDFFPRWILNNLPENLEVNAGIMEQSGFYGFSQDTMVLSGFTDGFEFGLTRLNSSTNNLKLGADIKVYPNPADSKIIIEGVNPGTPFRIYHINGSIINKGIVINNSIELNQISGTQILKFKIGNQWVTKKIVKME